MAFLSMAINLIHTQYAKHLKYHRTGMTEQTLCVSWQNNKTQEYYHMKASHNKGTVHHTLYVNFTVGLNFRKH